MIDRQRIVALLEKLDCYLIGDVTSMINAQPIGDCGGCGYPLLQTVISGSELCAKIEKGTIQKNTYGDKFFAYFVKEYMPTYYHSLTNLYGVFRNTPAHFFITSVKIYKGGNSHMVLNDGVLEINIVQLSNDFVVGFKKFKEKILSSEGKILENYMANISGILNKLSGEAKKISKTLEHDPEIQVRSYHNRVFIRNMSSVAASGIDDIYDISQASGPSTMTEEATKSLSKDKVENND